MVGLQFSGGKDSLAVLYLMRDRLSEITVYFGDTGMVYPHMSKFVRDTCEKLGAKLKVITPKTPIGHFQRDFGLPSDIVPVEATAAMQAYSKEKQPVRIQSVLSCCGAMLWQPLADAMREDGVTTIIRGSKQSDGHVGVADGYVDENGVTYSSPIWDWTDDDVFSYLKEVGAELPIHYSEVNNSFDCYACTAFLTHPGAKERLEWTKRNYPSLWPEIEMRLRAVRHVVETERKKVNDTISMLDENADELV